jgi:hypothetical protein
MSRALIFLVTAILSLSVNPTGRASASAKSKLGQAAVVIAYQIEGRLGPAPSLKDNPTIGDYPVLAFKILASSDETHHFGELVTSERKNGVSPSACFYPGLALSFVASGSRTDVFICLECHNMAVSGKSQVVGLSDRGIEEFTSLYRKLFQGGKSEQAR